MTTSDVSRLLGDPDGRELRENYEAWQYADIVGFGQCEYITIYFADGVVRTMTSIRGGSIAGCGLGSDPVNWAELSELGQKEQTGADPQAKDQGTGDKYSELIKLDDLREQGILTDAEFEAEKKKILDQD